MGARGPEKGRPEMPITPERRKVFLDTLARTGVWAEACRAASPMSNPPSGAVPCSSSFRALRRRSIEFDAACESAMEQAKAAVLLEIQRRGQDGWLEPVFNGKGTRTIDHDGTPASIRKFDSHLLLARARIMGLMPDEKHVHEHTVHHRGGYHSFTSDEIHLLSPEQRRALTDCLLTIQRRRVEADNAPALEYQPGEVMNADFEEVKDEETEFAYFDVGREEDT